MSNTFIEKLAPLAVECWQKYKILPSLTLAQAIVETGYNGADSSLSELAINANNLFGIKSHKGWTGGDYLKQTKEWDGTKYITITASFCKYPTMQACVEDRAKKLTTMQRYAPIVGETDIKKACELIQKCGWATSPTYTTALLNRVEKYNLTQYDITTGGATMKICIDPGHKQNYNKGVAAGYYEGNAMLELAKRLKAELEEYAGVEVILTRTNGDDLALAARGAVAVNNGCRLFISLHSNAGGGASTRGVEIYRSLQRSGSIELGDKLCKAIAGAMGTTNRGLKTRASPGTKTTDYYGVIRSAVKGDCVKEAYLIEHGFHTNATDCAWLNNNSNLQKLAELEAATIAGHYGLKKKAAESSTNESGSGSANGTLYRVQVGAFAIKANATALQAELKAKGYNSIIVTGTSVQGVKLYKVQLGAFSVKANATALQAELKRKGITAIIVAE